MRLQTWNPRPQGEGGPRNTHPRRGGGEPAAGGGQNAALPDIGKAFDASQLESRGCRVSLGLAAPVLWLGAPRRQVWAQADAHHRCSAVAAGTAGGRMGTGIEIRIIARSSVVWRPVALSHPPCRPHRSVGAGAPRRSRSGRRRRAISALGPLISGLFLLWWWWGSGVPGDPSADRVGHSAGPPGGAGTRQRETTRPVDKPRWHPVGAVGWAASSWRSTADLSQGPGPWSSTSGGDRPGVLIAFVIRERRSRIRCSTSPWRRRPIFTKWRRWTSSCSDRSMGAMFIGQQFLQNVLGYSTNLLPGLAILPAAVFHSPCSPAIL